MIEEFLTQLYRNFLGREPDAPGLSYWDFSIENGSHTAASVTREFLNSVEHQTAYKPIVQLYLAAFNRVPDKKGLDYWVNAYQKGASLIDIANAFVESDEFKNLHGQSADEQFIKDLYRSALSREPDGSGEMFWNSILDFGILRSLVMLSFATSPEMTRNRSAEVDYILLHRGVFGEMPTREMIDAVLPVSNWEALIEKLYEGQEYGGADVPGLDRYEPPEPAPVGPPEPLPDSDPGSPPDTVAPTILAFTVSSPTTLSVTSSEPGRASLYKESTPIDGSSTNLTSGNTPYNVTVAAQSVAKTTSLKVFDSAGNITTSSTKVLLGTNTNDYELLGTDSTSDYIFGFDGDDWLEGKLGADSLTGGSGNDIFYFLTVAGYQSSESTYASRDTITDLQLGDEIRIAVYGVQVFDAMSTAYVSTLTTPANLLVINPRAEAAPYSSQNPSVDDWMVIDLASYSPSDALSNGLVGFFLAGLNDATSADTLAGGAARDFLLGYRGNDLLQGNGGGDYVNGGEGDDILIGGLGSDELFGEAGSDVFVFNVGDSVSGTIDTISDFRTGNDSIRIIDNSGNLTGIDLTTDVIGVSALANNTSADLTVTQAGSINTLITITNKSGGLLTINSSMVQMDVTMANGGNRTVVGGDLADTIRGGNGNDSISGGAGADNLTGGAGSDSLYGGDGNDTFLFDEGAGNRVVNAATVVGGDGIDTIYATNGNANGGVTLVSADFARVASMERLELLAYSTGQATVTLGSETNAAFSNGITIFLNESATAPLIVNGALSNVTVNATGSANHDSLTGGIGADNLMGGLGADTLTGGAGSDTIDVGAGSTDIVVVNAVQGITSDSGTALGSSGLDTVSNFNKDQDFFRVVISNISSFNVENAVGTDGFSYLVNLNGDADWTDIGDIVVIVNGAFGNDSVAAQRASIFNITGTASNDIIITGINNDTITGGAGTDSLTGGDGTDTVSYADVTSSTSHGLANIAGMAINLSSASVLASTIDWLSGGRVALGGGPGTTGSDLAAGSAGYLATSSATSTATMVRDTLVGFEAVTGSTLSDYIALGAGGMTANGGAGKDTMIGGDGDDVFVISSGIDHEWLEEIHGNGGDDEIRFSSVIENDTLFLSWLVDVEEVRMLAADGSENNTLRLNINATGLGDRASIRLYGNEANNLVVGNEDGYNTIEGGDGNDSIMGGSMEDSLVGGAGMDSLTGGAGVDNFTGGSGADLFIQTTGAAPTSAGGRSATFGNGVDYVSDFNASEGDVLQGDGSALASSSIAVMDALPASGTYLFRGDWSAGTKIFSINNTGDDIMYATVTVTAGVLTGVSANAMILEGGFASFNVATNFVA